MIAMPFMNNFYIGRSAEGNRGQYAALYTMAWSAAQVIGSSTGPLIVAATGFFYLWIIVAGISFIGAAGYWQLYRQNGNNSLVAT